MNAVLTNNFQRSFFDKLELVFDKRGDMIQAVGEQLNVGRDAVYRRLRGDTVLSADELMILARAYNIKLDDRPANQAPDPQISYPAGMHSIKSEVDYYRILEESCQAMSALPEVSIDYATPELPLYYELFTPTLLAFRTYVYGLTTWNFKKWKGTTFDPRLIDPEVFKIAERLTPVLFNLPGRELWSIGIFDITLRQIEHAIDVGRLTDRALVAKMFDELEMIIKHMEATVSIGKRFAPGEANLDKQPPLEVYHNELTNTNNVVIINSPLQSFVYSTFVNPNYLMSSDDRIQSLMSIWFNNLISNSNSMNAAGSRYSQKFFATLRRTIGATKKRVDTLL